MKTKVAVVGFGNIGRAVIAALPKQSDMELVAVLTKRPEDVKRQGPDLPVFGWSQINSLPTKPDVAVLCGGSTNLLDEGQGPKWARICNTVCSFDDHGKNGRVPEYFAMMDGTAKTTKHVSIIATGWDPGTFSIEGVCANAFLGVKVYRFYGLTENGGLSMGHSQHAREVDGVADALQYTHAIPEAIELIRAGKNPNLTPGKMHWREVLVVLEPGADPKQVRQKIVLMPGYYEPYPRVEVKFVSREELDAERQRRGMAHDGLVIAVSETAPSHKAIIEYRCQWDSNPEGTARIMLAFARAAVRLGKEGRSGAFTPLDIPPAYLSPHSQEELLSHFV